MGTELKKKKVEDEKIKWRRLTEEDSHIVLALDQGLKSAGCYILNLIIMVINMKVLIDRVIATKVVAVMLLKCLIFQPFLE